MQHTTIKTGRTEPHPDMLSTSLDHHLFRVVVSFDRFLASDTMYAEDEVSLIHNIQSVCKFHLRCCPDLLSRYRLRQVSRGTTYAGDKSL